MVPTAGKTHTQRWIKGVGWFTWNPPPPPPPDKVTNIPVDPHINDHSDLNTAMLALCKHTCVPQCKARNMNQTTCRKLHFLTACAVLYMYMYMYMYMQCSCIRYIKLVLCMHVHFVQIMQIASQCNVSHNRVSLVYVLSHYQYMHTYMYKYNTGTCMY